LGLRLDVFLADFRYLDFRLDRFEIAISPPRPTCFARS
jgi:hypothetical protein